MRKRARLAATAAAMVVWGAAIMPPARAETGINIGSLTCSVAGGWGLILGSARPLVCTFTAYGGRSERYAGTLWKLGIDLGYTQNGVLMWTVFAPAIDVAPGTLSGTYAGGTASATIGLGVGANALIGGSFNSIVLQPLSLETNQGLNVAAGIASMTLTPGG